MMIDGGNILSASGRNARLPDDRGRLATFVLGVIFAGGLFDIALLAIEIDTDWSDRPVHLLAVLTLLFMLAAVGFGFRLLRNRMARSPAEQGVLDDLRRDKEAAETSNLAKARYLANVSHEIRSPLNAIYGYAQLIEQEANVQPKDAARIIRRCAEHMTSLVESLLDISRAQNGVLRLRNEVVRLPDFIEQIVMMMRPAAQAKGLEFICENAGRLPEFIRIDQSRFRQALINLLTNAIKFTDRGSVTFRISYRGQTATFEVIDTGPGIAPEDQRRIFDPYERIGIGEVAAQPGIGLGLPITKAIVEILGGMLELESTPGDGACFRIVMMLGEVAGMQVPATAQRRICGYDGAQRSILIVDDDPDQRSFLEEYLKACGFEVIVAPDGETAVDLCKLGIFDLAILDISLPGISGWETAMLLREGARRDLAIIMASANAQEFDRPDHHKPVHDLFFIKPYRLDEMAEAIGALLELSWKWEALGQAAAPAADGKTALPEAALAHVARLKELLRIGHVRGIEAEIELLERIPMIDKKLVSTLFAALDDFDLTGMALILEEM
ncbi:MAG TPA: ATP-binding protein [Sphingomonadaceae bacterium]|nr:ATP-binding protein [Sphingomonadaceae bacterium]